MTVRETIVLTSGTSWTVPNTWNSLSNYVTCIGGGAGGGARANSNMGGGGGGARAVGINLNLTPGTTVNYSIGLGGAQGVAGGDTSFNSDQVLAKGGSTTTTPTGGLGGLSATSVGTIKFAGGNGGNGDGSRGGGGGGAAGNSASGSNGSGQAPGAGGIGGARGSTFVFDLGSSQTIDRCEWFTGDDLPERDPVSWVIETSTDNVNWTRVFTVNDSSVTTTRNSSAGQSTFTARSARYVRWIVTKIRVSGNLIQLSTFNILNGATQRTIVNVTGPVGQPTATVGNLIEILDNKFCSLFAFPTDSVGFGVGIGGAIPTFSDGNTGTAGNPGFNLGNSLTQYGTNYSGSGGAGGGYDGAGPDYFAGGAGGLFGGGGGGGATGGGPTSNDGRGANGAIIIEWDRNPIPGNTVYSLELTTGTTWTVPSTWNNLNNRIECIGGGAGGNTAPNGAGGGGGARVINTNVTLTPGATVNYTIGAGGSPGSSGGDTSFNSGAMVAKGGSAATSVRVGGVGGQASASTGTTKYSGGNGGDGGAATRSGAAGGGGGAAGNTASGSAGVSATVANGLGGDGGAGGATNGGAGGLTGKPAQNGQISPFFNSNYAGGGGGGAGWDSVKGGYDDFSGGSGALYGGAGGGGGTTAGYGAQGAILITWRDEARYTVSMADINAELKDSPSDTTSLNDTDVRSLSGTSDQSQISFTDFYNKKEAITFVGNTTNTTSTTVSLPSGWQRGDMAVVTVVYRSYDTTISLASGSERWNHVANTGFVDSSDFARLTTFYKILETGDTAPSFLDPSSNFVLSHMVVLRGPSSIKPIAIRSRVSGSTLTLTEFAPLFKSTDSKALLSIVADAGTTTFPNPSPPAGWTMAGVSQRLYGERYTVEAATLPSSSFTNYSSVTWTSFGTAYPQSGILFELE